MFSVLQVSIGRGCSVPILEEFEASVVDFRHLHYHVTPTDIKLKRPLNARIFDRAQKQVYILLEQDPFLRWRKAIRDHIPEEQNAPAASEV